ncbi:hypothetical protein JCM10450v2_001651 [Rhodotorula kratochvilovae]
MRRTRTLLLLNTAVKEVKAGEVDSPTAIPAEELREKDERDEIRQCITRLAAAVAAPARHNCHRTEEGARRVSNRLMNSTSCRRRPRPAALCPHKMRTLTIISYNVHGSADHVWPALLSNCALRHGNLLHLQEPTARSLQSILAKIPALCTKEATALKPIQTRLDALEARLPLQNRFSALPIEGDDVAPSNKDDAAERSYANAAAFPALQQPLQSAQRVRFTPRAPPAVRERVPITHASTSVVLRNPDNKTPQSLAEGVEEELRAALEARGEGEEVVRELRWLGEGKGRVGSTMAILWNPEHASKGGALGAQTAPQLAQEEVEQRARCAREEGEKLSVEGEGAVQAATTTPAGAAAAGSGQEERKGPESAPAARAASAQAAERETSDAEEDKGDLANLAKSLAAVVEIASPDYTPTRPARTPSPPNTAFQKVDDEEVDISTAILAEEARQKEKNTPAGLRFSLRTSPSPVAASPATSDMLLVTPSTAGGTSAMSIASASPVSPLAVRDLARSWPASPSSDGDSTVTIAPSAPSASASSAESGGYGDEESEANVSWSDEMDLVAPLAPLAPLAPPPPSQRPRAAVVAAPRRTMRARRVAAREEEGQQSPDELDLLSPPSAARRTASA